MIQTTGQKGTNALKIPRIKLDGIKQKVHLVWIVDSTKYFGMLFQNNYFDLQYFKIFPEI